MLKREEKICKGRIYGYKGYDINKGFDDSTVDYDIEWFHNNIMKQKCYYCGVMNYEIMGADRIDNNLGHCKDNIVPCCRYCNIGRNNKFTVEEYRKYKQEQIDYFDGYVKQGCKYVKVK